MGRAPCCDKDKVKRGPWSPEEDAVLKAYIEKNGIGGNWITLPQRAGIKRCGKSCRLRWLNYLRPEIKHGGFSSEEDTVICALYRALGSRWSVIASRLPGRTDNDVKNYWNTKLKKRYSAHQHQAAQDIPAAVSVGHASIEPSPNSAPLVPPAGAVSTPSTTPSSVPPLAPTPTTTTTTTTPSCSFPYLPPVDYPNVRHVVRTTSSFLHSRHPVFVSSSIEGGYVVPHGSKDDVSSSGLSAASASPSLNADYVGSSSAFSFGSTMIDDYILPTTLEDVSTTTSYAAAATPSSSSLTMDYSGSVGYQPWPEADESFFAEAEAAFESYYFSSSASSSANMTGWSGAAGGPHDGNSGAGDSGLLWDLVVDSAYS